MKFMISLVSILLFSAISQATTIDLSSGSSARIRAGEEVLVSCAGSGTSRGSQCHLKNNPQIPQYFDVYAGDAKVGNQLSLSSAGELIKKLQRDGVCH